MVETSERQYPISKEFIFVLMYRCLTRNFIIEDEIDASAMNRKPYVRFRLFSF